MGLRLCQDVKAFPNLNPCDPGRRDPAPGAPVAHAHAALPRPTSNYRFRSLTPGAPGPGANRYPIPPEGKENARGLPIGNLTSQFFGFGGPDAALEVDTRLGAIRSIGQELWRLIALSL